MNTFLIYPAENLFWTLTRGKNKNPNTTPGRAKARRMPGPANVPLDVPVAEVSLTGIAYGAPDKSFAAGTGYSDIRTALAGVSKRTGQAASPVAIDKDGQASRSFADSALERESALWGARSPWGESALWRGSAAKGNNALYAESAPWQKALCGERRRRMQPVV